MSRAGRTGMDLWTKEGAMGKRKLGADQDAGLAFIFDA